MFFSTQNVISQSLDEFEEYINVEVRDTHILYVHLLQSEIGGEVTTSAKISYMEENNRIYVFAQSVIKTDKDFDTIRSDINRAMARLDESEYVSLSRSRMWQYMSNGTQLGTTWTISQRSTRDKAEIAIYYSIADKELIVALIPLQTIPTN